MKVCVYTLGCKVNTYESEYVINELIKNGFEIGNFDDKCDIYIINTCTVTNTSDVKSRKIIRQAKRKNPDGCVIAMGCFTQANKVEVPEGADIVLGNKYKSKIISIIDDYFKNREKKILLDDDFDKEFEDMFVTHYYSHTRAFVKIQDGCENFCSYCIIPFVRGKCRSKDFDKAIREIKELVANGFKEIVLTGIHTGNYGSDNGRSFAELLREIVKIKGLQRLRISSIEATELNDEVLEIIKKNPVIVDHLHIPIQAASDHVLKLMRRKYNLDYFIKKIDLIRNIRPNISISTDIIVGFPEETDEDFASGIEVLKRINFSKLHVFPYSKRDGTKAAEMVQVDGEVKKKRSHELLKLSRELEIDYMNKFIGQEVCLLVERNRNGCALGHTGNYLQVKLDTEVAEGEFVNCVLDRVEYPFVIGHISK